MVGYLLFLGWGVRSGSFRILKNAYLVPAKGSKDLREIYSEPVYKCGLIWLLTGSHKIPGVIEYGFQVDFTRLKAFKPFKLKAL